ncbi:MAG: ribosome-associated ATPase/putative transporter RbbA [Myxococcota bacterium]
MTAAPEAVARLSAVSHRYGDTLALAEATTDIPGRALVGLIGPDGVGKSTLLGLLAGARRIQSGRVTVLGGDMADARHRSAVCTRIAYMPQGLGKNLYAELSVFENLDFFGRLFGRTAGERRERIEILLRATGLEPFHARPAGKLSGGMKQKLGLCCALIHDPDLLILDEPTTGVDPLSRGQFWDLIARMREGAPELSVLVSTAYMDEAERFDWLIAMDAGALLASGTPDQLLRTTGAASLEAAFVRLLPAAKRGSGEPLSVPPRRRSDEGPVIVARDLTRRFGDFTAVDRVSFEIERGEIFGFLGSNGCGKTTTMKMLTGLLPASEGEAELFGRPVDARNLETRRRVGYMSQSFSLYGELTVRQNLDLHARLFRLDPGRARRRIAELLDRFGLADRSDERASQLPLGVRQRLSLAVAIIHEPEMLILDEPTSGVDPVARDAFWSLLIDLSRTDGVTIFISTHFMNEGGRCDRISLMHAGTVLACDRPAALVAERRVETLEEAFVGYIRDAIGAGTEDTRALARLREPAGEAASAPAGRRRGALPLGRLLAYTYRESLEVLRDPIRLAFAFAGSALLMLVFAYGITMDVEDVRYGALDLDRTPESRAYLRNFEGSRYFEEQPPIGSPAEAQRRLESTDVSLVLEIPPGFGRDLRRGDRPGVSAWIDGAMPFRGETIHGYVSAVHARYLEDLAAEPRASAGVSSGVEIESRYRYNPSFESIYAIAPGIPPILLILIPAILMAVSVAREKELGSITNFYVTPTTRLEFLVGKQLPYVAIGFLNFVLLTLMAIFLFRVPLGGSALALTLGALLYVTATTGLGLLTSTFTRTQVAAVFATAILTMMPTMQFSGLIQPVSTLEGGARLIGSIWPTAYYTHLSLGTFTKALGLRDVATDLVAIAAFIPVFTLLATLALREQDR